MEILVSKAHRVGWVHRVIHLKVHRASVVSKVILVLRASKV